MKHLLLTAAVACLSTVIFDRPALAADAAIAPGDVMFAKKAAMGGMMEVKMGEVAEKNAASPDVKAFGAQMVTDHGKAGEELTAIATKEKIDIPTKLSAKKQAMIDTMAKLQGKEFDTAYVRDMVMDHKMDVAAFKAATAKLQDPELKAFAEKTLTVIEGHLQKIEAIQAAMK